MNRAATTSTPLAEAYSARRPNSIGFLRWVFASAVIVYHGYIIAAFTKNPIDRELGSNLGRTAVDCFFLLSGFLVARSYRSSSGFIDYLWKRSLRIYPAFWLCLILTVVLFGPLSWIHNHGTIHGYRGVEPWRYVTGNWTLRLHNSVIPGTFRDTRLAQKTHLSTPNGSLWTLFYEFRCYVVVGLLGLATLLWTRRRVPFVITVVLGTLLLAQSAALSLAPQKTKEINAALGVVVEPLRDRNLAMLLFAFLIGTCFALYADRVVVDDRIGLACVAAVLLVLRWHGDFSTLAMAPLGYVILWLGVRLPMTWWDRAGDTSYGVYLYGWPVEALFAEYHLHQRLGIHLYLVLSIAVSTLLGWVSWHVLEARALRLKAFDPYRWALARWRSRRAEPGAVTVPAAGSAPADEAGRAAAGRAEPGRAEAIPAGAASASSQVP